jgi:hypothetical protein
MNLAERLQGLLAEVVMKPLELRAVFEVEQLQQVDARSLLIRRRRGNGGPQHSDAAQRT